MADGADRDHAGSGWLRAAMRSHPGRVRAQNQDACLVDLERGLFAVADGVGGQRAGDVAARIAVEHLPAFLDRARRDAPGAPGAAVERAVVELGALVQAEAAADPRLTGMGTTLVLALITEVGGAGAAAGGGDGEGAQARGGGGDGVGAQLAHAGDSRAYLLRGGRLRRLTEDHSYAGELVRGGLLDPSAASAHPLAHAVTRALGMPGALRPEVRELDLAPGDRLLLCSDGLTDMLADDRVAPLLAQDHDPEATCQALVDAANAAGGRDNVSVVVIDLPGGAGR